MARLTALHKHAPWLAVTALGGFLLWPVPLGLMPLSADHTVHLTRAWMWSEALARGRLHDWSEIWFFGTPVGELYPVLGDLLVIAFRVMSAAQLSWPQAYALAFSLVFIAPAWAMLRAGACLGLGRTPGLMAAALILLDVGAYREGGWIYTVDYGVWPQSLATAASWWGFAELGHACRATSWFERRPRIAAAALAQALALLAHPMALLTLVIGGPLVVVAMGRPWQQRWRDSASTGLWVVLLALGASAWWLGPMLEHRAWMASYGWLWIPLRSMLQGVAHGAWSQAMPPGVGYAISLGLLLAAVRGSPLARAYALVALALWVLAARDLAWTLRLDRISEGFTHLQYQRFITAAKPGLFLLAGLPVAWLVEIGQRQAGRWRALWFAMAGLGATVLIVQAGLAMSRSPTGGKVQLERLPGNPALDADYARLTAWLEERWRAREALWRITFHAARNQHWFMDAPVLAAGVPVFKQGFTPGDNFVHKPESGHPRVLDRAAVRYVIASRVQPQQEPVARFGAFAVYERASWSPIAWLEGPGTLEILAGQEGRSPVRVRARGTGPSTRLTFGIAGYPRWHLRGPGGEVPWVEAPVLGHGPTASPQERRSGTLRGGKARGDDGREPTLIQAPIRDGEYALHYVAWTSSDIAALVWSLLSLTVIGVFMRAPKRRDPAFQRLDRCFRSITHPWIVAACLLGLVVAVSIRVHRARVREASTAVGYAHENRATEVRAMQPGFLKTEMLIRPAMLVRRRHQAPATLLLPHLAAGTTVSGWFALDDDEAQMRRKGQHHVRIERRNGGGPWASVREFTVPLRPGRVMLDPITDDPQGSGPFDLRVTVESRGDNLPRLGFDLDIQPPSAELP